MIFWLDAQLPPALAEFLKEQFDVEALPLRDIGMRDADDAEIFEKARAQNVVLISKDSDFVELVQRLGTPPQLLWAPAATPRTSICAGYYPTYGRTP